MATNTIPTQIYTAYLPKTFLLFLDLLPPPFFCEAEDVFVRGELLLGFLGL